MLVLLPANILQVPSSLFMLVFAEIDHQELSTFFLIEIFNSADSFVSFKEQWETLAFSAMTILET